MTSKQLSEFRNRHLGFVFQFHHLLPEFSAVENVMMPAWIGNRSAGAAERKRAVGLLERLELGHRVEHKPAQLSGGEQQRVAIARAMMNRPALILADEPTGNLDEQTSRPMLELIRELNRTEEVGFVIATHDAELAERADRVLRLYEGQLHEETRVKRPNDMLNSPETSASALGQGA